MVTLTIILLSAAIIGLVLYFGEFKFEFKFEKDATENKGEINKSSLDCLSNTELNILRLVSEGKSNQEIADNQFISVHTVKKHISNIFKKLNINSRAETRKYKDLIHSEN